MTEAKRQTDEVGRYAREVAAVSGTGHGGEHAFRGCLENLFSSLNPGLRAINEGEMSEHDRPDFRVEWRTNVLVGHVETKKPGTSLQKEESSEQMERYLQKFSNLLLTDYLEFRHYVNGRVHQSCRLPAANQDGSIPRPSRKQKLELTEFLLEFVEWGNRVSNETLTAEQLAETLARKTRRLKKQTVQAMEDGNSDLAGLYSAFQSVLIRDLPQDSFADIFAQTATYGLFAARLEAARQDLLHEFKRDRIRSLLPETTPLLRKFFHQFLQGDLPPDMGDTIDNIVDYLRATNMDNITQSFRKNGGQLDPFLHFYETFLAKYDPDSRKSRGVYYTPDAAVDFIVRAVDDALRDLFNMPDGLADSEKVECLHRTQILDPAAGTGAFLARVIRVIEKLVSGRGNWADYAAEHLVPRLHGFENMMSAYAMCHMKFALELGERAMQQLASRKQRPGIYLTDSLDHGERKQRAMGLGWLADEAMDARKVKTETPVMVVLGNPPYNVKSKNRGRYISDLLDDYKKDLNERKLNLDDDYIKFIRNAEDMICRNGQGMVSFVCNNSFYNGVTHRRMRWHLMRSFDRIYVLNLHGNARIHEKTPDGYKDENIFNIMQGVGIFLMVKTGKSQNMARIFYADCYGQRQDKYKFLFNSSLKSIHWEELSPEEPYYFFSPKDFSVQKKYDQGIKVSDLFPAYVSGIQTKRDKLTVCFTEEEMQQVKQDMLNLSAEQIRDKYELPDDGRDWTVGKAKTDAKTPSAVCAPYSYRPFDTRYTLYTGTTKGFIAYPRNSIMRHIINRDNIALIAPRSCKGHNGFEHGFITRHIADIAVGDAYSGSGTYIFPLYIYEEIHGEKEKIPNIDKKAVAPLASAARMKYGENEEMTPEAVLDYVYAVLHNPHYRIRFAELLKIDFPKIPLPKSAEHFCKTADTGARLRKLHLLEDDSLNESEIFYDSSGDDVVGKVSISQAGNETDIFINDSTAFRNIPGPVWNFSVGGYLPAQKWLKDRRGRKLSWDDQSRYRRILTALARTQQIMDEMEDF